MSLASKNKLTGTFKGWDGKVSLTCPDCGRPTSRVNWSQKSNPYVVDVASCTGCGAGFVVSTKPVFDSGGVDVGFSYKFDRIQRNPT